MHPDDGVIICAEVAAEIRGFAERSDIFLLIPTIWSGWGSWVLDLAGDFVKSECHSTAPSTPEWGRNFPLHLDIFVGDIMLIGPKIGNRLNMVAKTVESVVRGSLGCDAISEENIASVGDCLAITSCLAPWQT